MRWSSRSTLVAGLVLIAASNAVALLGVWYNRSGEPESVLRLTQRELAVPWGGFDHDSSGLDLTMQWRTLMKTSYNPYPAIGGEPEWLDRAKLEALGYDLSRAQNTRGGKRQYIKLKSKQVFVVLELDGPAYQEALRRAQKLADEKVATPKPTTDLNTPAENLKNERTIASRLFVIDAGLDPVELRNKYTDRGRYAIARGRVSANFNAGNATTSEKLTGFLSEVIGDRVSVPIEFRNVLESLPRSNRYPGQDYPISPVEAEIAFGKRFEPWIVAASSAGK